MYGAGVLNSMEDVRGGCADLGKRMEEVAGVATLKRRFVSFVTDLFSVP
jgi:hypothetical protein